MDKRPYNTDQELIDLIPEVSNWGKWGKEDQIGTLNYLTQEHVKQAASLVTTGRTVSLSRLGKVPNYSEHEGRKIHEYKMNIFEDVGFSNDFVGLVFHGFQFTHIDGLNHVFTNKKQMYNGFSIDELKEEGAKKLGVEHFARKGITGRGVLLDIALLRGGKLKPGDIIYLDDLLEAEKNANIKVKEGDILFVRSGTGCDNQEVLSGMHPECIPWFHERKISVLGNDGGSDYYPSHYEKFILPIHGIAIPYMGLPLIDNADLDELSEVCREENRWEFMITISPWRLKGVTGSPVNPIAIF